MEFLSLHQGMLRITRLADCKVAKNYGEKNERVL